MKIIYGLLFLSFLVHFVKGAGNYGETCRPFNDPNGQCNTNLQCLGDLCKCTTAQYWNPKENSCQMPVGSACNTGNAQFCIENSGCFNSICNCVIGYSQDSGFCKPKYGYDCSTNAQDVFNHCHPGIGLNPSYTACISGTCQCTQGYEWWTSLSACRGLVNSACVGDLIGDSCTDDAECVNNVCKCKEHHAPTNDRHCTETSYESSCEQDRNCDIRHFLTCKNGQCLCEDLNDMKWDGKDECVALRGTECYPEYINDRQLDCENGFGCEDVDENGYGICGGLDCLNVTTCSFAVGIQYSSLSTIFGTFLVVLNTIFFLV